ncbi:hypothetical protein [Acinetobacter ursingii]|uniref:hypothetical protein n=1 Tax=Acinetobacter ursingii TaxID=108980 RepID=UPI00124EAD4F|nr:hypothetical protein [Acinetobacter ursingii]
MTKSTLAIGLAASFLQLAQASKIETHNIDGLGEIGIKELTIENRDIWMKAQKENNNPTVVLLQHTVCEPETGELVLKQVSVDDLKQLPMTVVNDIVGKVFKQNKIETAKTTQSEELKNSDASQS